MLRSGTPNGRLNLMNDVKFNLRNTSIDNSQSFCRRIRDVDNASGNVWTAVIDANCDRSPGRDICHAQPGTEWQRRVSGSQLIRIELFAVRCLLSIRVEAGDSVRCCWRRGCVFVRRVLDRFDRDTPVGDRGLLVPFRQRRLSTGAQSGCVRDGRGLHASTKRRRRHDDGNQSNKVPNTR
jgi:hypothetical protein